MANTDSDRLSTETITIRVLRERLEKAERALVVRKEQHEPECEYRRGVGAYCSCHEMLDMYKSRLENCENELQQAEEKIREREDDRIQFASQAAEYVTKLNECEKKLEAMQVRAERIQKDADECVACVEAERDAARERVEKVETECARRSKLMEAIRGRFMAMIEGAMESRNDQAEPYKFTLAGVRVHALQEGLDIVTDTVLPE